MLHHTLFFCYPLTGLTSTDVSTLHHHSVLNEMGGQEHLVPPLVDVGATIMGDIKPWSLERLNRFNILKKRAE